MQLPQSTPEIPELGGLSSRRADLAQRGIDALRKISALLARARRRARLLAVLRAAALVLAGLVFAGLCGALVGSFAGAAYARGAAGVVLALTLGFVVLDRKSTRLNSSHLVISYAVFCLKKKK